MRLCHGLLCDEAADVWMRGKPWCTACAIKRFGIVAPSVIGAAPRGGGTARRLSPVPTSPPQPLYDDPLVALLEEQGWDLLDIELELVSRLEGELGW